MAQPLDSTLSAPEIVRIVEEKCEAGVFSLDLASREITLSSWLATMLGFAGGNHCRPLSDLLELVHPYDRISVHEAAAAVERAVPVRGDIRVLTRDGGMRWLNLQCEFLLDAAGHPAKLIGVAADATASHRSACSAIAGQERLHGLVTGIAPIVWAARPDGYLTEMMGWETVTGMRDGKALGNGWLECVHPDDRDPTLAQWYVSIERKTMCDSEIRVLQSDGTYRWCRVYGAPRFGKSGTIREWNGMAIDIHARVESRDRDHGRIITGAQIRASRGILNWSVGDLSNAAGVTAAVIRRLETNEGASPKSKADVDALTAALSDAGVEFTFERGVAPGVRPS